MLILSKRCEKTFGFDKKMQRSGSSPERSAKFDHSLPITFLDRKVNAYRIVGAAFANSEMSWRPIAP